MPWYRTWHVFRWTADFWDAAWLNITCHSPIIIHNGMTINSFCYILIKSESEKLMFWITNKDFCWRIFYWIWSLSENSPKLGIMSKVWKDSSILNQSQVILKTVFRKDAHWKSFSAIITLRLILMHLNLSGCKDCFR